MQRILDAKWFTECKLLAWAVALAWFSSLSACSSQAETQHFHFESPAIPSGFSVTSAGQLCTQSVGEFDAEIAVPPGGLTRAVEAMLGTCAERVLTMKTLISALARPSVVAATATYEFAACVADTSRHAVSVKSASLRLRTGDWERC